MQELAGTLSATLRRAEAFSRQYEVLIVIFACRYEAWVIYNFLSLCLAWVGGPGAVVTSLQSRVLEPSWHLMTCCCHPIPLDGFVSQFSS